MSTKEALRWKCEGRSSDDLDSNERAAELKAWWKDYLAQA